ncbi:hypothetical protein BC831DRAFT_63970 [Entophlyctis helioformis]|nr:hypothetical protein BC831DRAFT_63970 [Entophlyctis helioformis]
MPAMTERVTSHQKQRVSLRLVGGIDVPRRGRSSRAAAESASHLSGLLPGTAASPSMTVLSSIMQPIQSSSRLVIQPAVQHAGLGNHIAHVTPSTSASDGTRLVRVIVDCVRHLSVLAHARSRNAAGTQQARSNPRQSAQVPPSPAELSGCCCG